MTVQLQWKRHEYTTRGFDPTVVVEWTMIVNGRKMLTVTEFQAIYQTTFHVPTRFPDLNYWEMRAKYLEDQWQSDRQTKEEQRAEAEWEAMVAAMTPEQRAEMESMELVREDLP